MLWGYLLKEFLLWRTLGRRKWKWGYTGMGTLFHSLLRGRSPKTLTVEAGLPSVPLLRGMTNLVWTVCPFGDREHQFLFRQFLWLDILWGRNHFISPGTSESSLGTYFFQFFSSFKSNLTRLPQMVSSKKCEFWIYWVTPFFAIASFLNYSCKITLDTCALRSVSLWHGLYLEGYWKNRTCIRDTI